MMIIMVHTKSTKLNNKQVDGWMKMMKPQSDALNRFHQFKPNMCTSE